MEVCGGAEPLECAPKFQIRNPKRVQGFVPAEGLGVPPQLYQSPKIEDSFQEEWGPEG